jgi:isochorismate pyruvate lyase
MNKLPEDCENLADIRQEIDRLDREIITKLSQRYNYVKAASKFKTSETSVKAPERFKSMLETRRNWAESEGLNPDVIEKMYRDLVEYFIQEELQHWSSNS